MAVAPPQLGATRGGHAFRSVEPRIHRKATAAQHLLCEHPAVLIRGGVGLGIILVAVWVYCLLDVIMADEHRIRNLSKGTWILIVLFTFEVGAVAWLVAGRPQSTPRGLPYCLKPQPVPAVAEGAVLTHRLDPGVSPWAAAADQRPPVGSGRRPR